MADEDITFYIQASSSNQGALGIFQFYGPETELTRIVDKNIHGKKSPYSSNTFATGKLRYGWLRDAAGVSLDEVLLAKPMDGVRSLMTHGGAAIRTTIRNWLSTQGIPELDALRSALPYWATAKDRLLQPLLASCVTETQTAAVLAAMDSGEAVPSGLLATRRAVLAGPANAGKSSLLNQLSGYDRAFTHADAGATRDAVDELVDLGGYAVLLGDLPGYWEEADAIGKAAWAKAVEALGHTEALLFVCDASADWTAATDAAAAAVAQAIGDIPVAVLLNKSDLPRAVSGEPWKAHFPDALAASLCSLPGGNAREKVDGVANALFGFCIVHQKNLFP